MQYIEYKPKEFQTQHIESFWSLHSGFDNYNKELIVTPELVFDIIFVRKPILVKTCTSHSWTLLNIGVYFIGLFDISFYFKFLSNTDIFGIRIKPFALANIKTTMFRKFYNQITPLFQVFDIKNNNLIELILKTSNINETIELATNLVESIVTKFEIEDSLRQKINFVMVKKGIVKNTELYDIFDTNKATLRNHFLSNTGLTPKNAIKMMRINNALQSKFLYNRINLTELACDSGYFDQSHFIKDVKSIFNCTPKELFIKNDSTILSMERIHRRFSSYYAPLV